MRRTFLLLVALQSSPAGCDAPPSSPRELARHADSRASVAVDADAGLAADHRASLEARGDGATADGGEIVDAGATGDGRLNAIDDGRVQSRDSRIHGDLGQVGKTYHVAPSGDDKGPGTERRPWQTVAKANQSLRAGDTAILHAGSYNDPIRPQRNGLSDARRITYRAAGDGEVFLTRFFGAEGPREGALALGEKRYVTVTGRSSAGDPARRWIKLRPAAQVNALGNVCGSEGVIVENIDAECASASRACNRGFAFCIGFWNGNHETKYNVLRNSRIVGFSRADGDQPASYTEDLVTLAHNSHHNLIEDNDLSVCRHTVLYADSPESHSNVIRGNDVRNPQHTALSIWSAGVGRSAGARFLVEDNRLQGSGETAAPHGGPGGAFQWGSDELIIRYNVITGGGAADQQISSVGGLIGATSTSFGAPYFATDGRVYHNSIVANRGVAIGMLDFGVDPVALGRHRFVNNMIYGSESNVTGRGLVLYWDASRDTEDQYWGNVFGNPQRPASDAVLQSSKRGAANLDQAVQDWSHPADPSFSSLPGYPDRYDADPGFVDYRGADYRLATDSPYKNAGAPLTQVSPNDAGRGQVLRVEDARFFFAEANEFPAWMGVENDWVAIGPNYAGAQPVELLSVDDATGQLELATAVQRRPGDHVWLYKDSRGRIVARGSAPAVGAFDPAE